MEICDERRNIVTPPTDHMLLVHNLYRHILSHHTLPAHKRFELLVSLSTNTFGIEMMPPSFLDNETVVVNRRGYGVDCGIDHINLTKTVVGQSKRYTGTNKVDWADISKFFLASECLATPPSVRFLATLPSTGVTKRALGAMQLKHIEHKRFDEATLATLPVCSAPSTAIPDTVCTADGIVMRPTQADVITAFHASPRAVFTFEAAPGWGKTRVALFLGHETYLRGGRVVYLVHTVDLLTQTRSTFEAAGVPASVVTYQSAHHVAALADGDLLIADEAHHLDRDGDWNAAVCRIGSACRTFKMSGRYDSHTEVDYTVSYDAAIEEGVVADYRVVLQSWTPGVRTWEIARFLHETPTLGPLVFVFWNSVENAEAGHRASCELLDTSAVVTGTTPDAERVRIRRLAEEGYLRVMHLCGCYNEGISIAAVSTVVFGDPRQSPKNVFQCQARANRLHHTKPFYRVVLPILGDADLDVVAQYVGALSMSDERVHDALSRLVDGHPTARVVVNGCDEATCTRVVEYLGTSMRSMIDEKIAILAALSEKPHSKHVTTIRRGDVVVEVNIGWFLCYASQNWKEHGTPRTRLTDAQKARVAAAPWFGAALAAWQKAWDAAAQVAFVPTVDEKIEKLVALSEKPLQKAVATIRRGDETVEVRIGGFLCNISQHWKEEHGKPITRLTDAQKARVAAAPWFGAAIVAWQKVWNSTKKRKRS